MSKENKHSDNGKRGFYNNSIWKRLDKKGMWRIPFYCLLIIGCFFFFSIALQVYGGFGDLGGDCCSGDCTEGECISYTSGDACGDTGYGTCCEDSDGDGYYDDSCGGDDCDDSDPDEKPGQEWYNDDDDDGWYEDKKTQCSNPGDGWTTDSGKGGGDCDDSDSDEKPGQEWYNDDDGDNYYESTKTQCSDPGTGWGTSSRNGGGDCDDLNENVNPGSSEECGNDIDENCDGIVAQCEDFDNVTFMSGNVEPLTSEERACGAKYDSKLSSEESSGSYYYEGRVATYDSLNNTNESTLWMSNVTVILYETHEDGRQVKKYMKTNSSGHFGHKFYWDSDFENKAKGKLYLSPKAKSAKIKASITPRTAFLNNFSKPFFSSYNTELSPGTTGWGNGTVIGMTRQDVMALNLTLSEAEEYSNWSMKFGNNGSAYSADIGAASMVYIAGNGYNTRRGIFKSFYSNSSMVFNKSVFNINGSIYTISTGEKYAYAGGESNSTGKLDKFYFNGTEYTDWNATVEDLDSVYGLAIGYNNGVYVVGPKNKSTVVKKYSSSGNLLWNNTINKETALGSDPIHVGSYVYLAGGNSTEGWIKKMTLNGTEIWNKSFVNKTYRAARTNFGGQYLYTVGYNNSDAIVEKYNSSGSLLWNETIKNGSAYSVDFDRLGNAYVVGSENSNWFVKKFFPNGSEDTDWNLTFEKGTAHSVKVSNDENVYVVGERNNSWQIKKFGTGLTKAKEGCNYGETTATVKPGTEFYRILDNGSIDTYKGSVIVGALRDITQEMDTYSIQGDNSSFMIPASAFEVAFFDPYTGYKLYPSQQIYYSGFLDPRGSSNSSLGLYVAEDDGWDMSQSAAIGKRIAQGSLASSTRYNFDYKGAKTEIEFSVSSGGWGGEDCGKFPSSEIRVEGAGSRDVNIENNTVFSIYNVPQDSNGSIKFGNISSGCSYPKLEGDGVTGQTTFTTGSSSSTTYIDITANGSYIGPTEPMDPIIQGLRSTGDYSDISSCAETIDDASNYFSSKKDIARAGLSIDPAMHFTYPGHTILTGEPAVNYIHSPSTCSEAQLDYNLSSNDIVGPVISPQRRKVLYGIRNSSTTFWIHNVRMQSREKVVEGRYMNSSSDPGHAHDISPYGDAVAVALSGINSGSNSDLGTELYLYEDIDNDANYTGYQLTNGPSDTKIGRVRTLWQDDRSETSIGNRIGGYVIGYSSNIDSNGNKLGENVTEFFAVYHRKYSSGENITQTCRVTNDGSEYSDSNEFRVVTNETTGDIDGDGNSDTIMKQMNYFAEYMANNNGSCPTSGIAKTTPEENQSKIVNNGDKTLSFYLLMNVEYYNGSSWEYVQTVINDTETGTIRDLNLNETLALDKVWNPVGWNTADGFGTGTYRVVSEMIGPNGTVLKNIEGDEFITSYNFTVSESYLLYYPIDAETSKFNITDEVGNPIRGNDKEIGSTVEGSSRDWSLLNDSVRNDLRDIISNRPNGAELGQDEKDKIIKGRLDKPEGYSLDKNLEFKNERGEKRFETVGKFSQGHVNLTNLVLRSNNHTTVVNTSDVKGIGQTHKLYLPNTLDNGVYVCPHAQALSEMDADCANKTEFTYEEANSGTWKNNIKASLSGDDYVVENLTGSGVTEVNDTTAPSVTLNSPLNGSTGISTSPTLNVTVTDPNGDSMNVTFYDASDDSQIGTNNNVSNGSDATVTWSSLNKSATYEWYVNVDGNDTTQSEIWNFTTLYDEPPKFTHIPANDSIIYSTDWGGVDFNATDESGIDEWFIDDTNNFTINQSGYLDDNPPLASGNYKVNVSVNDTSGNVNMSYYQLEVNKIPTNLSIWSGDDPDINNYKTNESINLYANYTENGSEISFSFCNITLWNGTTSSMESFLESSLFEYSTTTPNSTGIYPWNVTCEDEEDGYEKQIENGTIVINDPINLPLEIYIENPENNTVFDYSTTQVNIEATTNKNSTCDYSLDEGSTNHSMTSNSTGTGHTADINVSPGNEYTANLYCEDEYNKSAQESVRWNVSYQLNASIQIKTLEKIYGEDEWVNLTDPPGVSTGPHFKDHFVGLNITVNRSNDQVEVESLNVKMEEGSLTKNFQKDDFTKIDNSYYLEEDVLDQENITFSGYASYNFTKSGVKNVSSFTTITQSQEANSTLNATAFKDSKDVFENSNISVYKKGKLSRHKIYSKLLSTSNGFLNKPVVNNTNYDLSFSMPDENEVKIKDYKINSKHQEVDVQSANVSGKKPSNVTGFSKVLASEAEDFDKATLYYSISYTPDKICRCEGWNYTTNDCTTSWQCNSTEDYPHDSNMTHFWFNTTHFTGYALGSEEETQLKIWNDKDNYLKGDQVEFYANYTENGSAITSSYCNITLWNGSTYEMIIESPGSSVFTYSAKAPNSYDTYVWNTSCWNNDGYDNLTASDEFKVSTGELDNKTTPEENQSFLISYDNVQVCLNMSVEYLNDTTWIYDNNVTSPYQVDLTKNKKLGIDLIWNDLNKTSGYNTNERNYEDGKYRAKVQTVDCEDHTPLKDKEGEDLTAYHNFSIDTTPPSIQTPSNNTSIIEYGEDWSGVDFNSTDTGKIDEWSIKDNENFTIDQSGHLDDISILPAGDYKINISVNDTAGNVNSTVHTLTVIEATPELTLDIVNSTYPEKETINASALNTGDSDLDYNLYVDDVNETSGSDIDYSEELAAGNHTVEYNTSGGQNYTSNSITKTLEISKGNVNIDLYFSGNGSTVMNSNYTINYGEELNVTSVISITRLNQIKDSLFDLYKDGSEVGNLSTDRIEYLDSSLSPGTYYFNSTWKGNENYSGFTRDPTVTVVDPSGPNLTINKNTTQLEYSQESIHINWTSTDNHDIDTTEFNVTYPNGSLLYEDNSRSGEINLTSENLTETGTYEINLWANDTADNTKSRTDSFEVNDTISPTISFIPLTTSGNNSQSYIEANVTSSDAQLANVTIDLYDSEGIYQSNTSPTDFSVNFTSLPDGKYYLNATAIDLSGNKNSTETRNIILDTTGPSISINTPLDNDIVGWSILLDAEVNDMYEVDTVEYDILNDSSVIESGEMYLEDETYNSTFETNKTWPYDANELNSTNLTLRVTANDTLGNERENSTSWILDNTKPNIQHVNPDQEGEYFNTDFNLTVYLSNTLLNYSSYNITSPDGSVIQDGSEILNTSIFRWEDYVNISKLGEGNNTLTTFASDRVSNNRTKITWFYVDKTEPSLEIEINDSDLDHEIESVSINWTANDNELDKTEFNVTYPNGSLLYEDTSKSGEINLTPSNLTQVGEYNITLWAKDTAQNTNQISREFYVNDTIIENSTVENSTVNNSEIINSTKLNTTIINSTVKNSFNNNSYIENVKEIDSNMTNSTVEDSLINDSSLDDSNVTDSMIDNSTVDDSQISNSTKLNTIIINSTIEDSFNNNSYLENVTEIDSNMTNSTVEDSLINDSSLDDSNVTDSTLDNSTVDNSEVSNSTKLNTIIINSTIEDSFNNNSYLENVTEIDSNITDSTVEDSIINESEVDNSLVEESRLTNSTVINSTVRNCTLINDELINGVCIDGFIDTIPPEFTFIPENDTIEYGEDWGGVNFNATDESGIDEWSIDDNDNFTMNKSGYLDEKVPPLDAGNHTIRVSVNDTLGNTETTTYELVIEKSSTNLSIWSGKDSYNTNKNVNFYANYTADNSSIADVSSYCNITSWNGTTYSMTRVYHGSSFFDYSTTTPNSKGTYSWNVTCEADNFEKQMAHSSIDVTSQPEPSCFPAGTDILMANGDYKDIENVDVGDYVAGYDFDNNKKSDVRVEEIESPKRYHMCELSFGNSELELTNEHPVYTLEGWKSISPEETHRENEDLDVQELEEGDNILLENRTFSELMEIECWEEESETYNLKHVENNNYYAGNVLVHNKDGCSDECSPEGESDSRCVDDSTVESRECGDYDSDNCLEWSDWESSDCGSNEECSDGECLLSCVDECDSDETECYNTTTLRERTCDDMDGDGCLELSDWEYTDSEEDEICKDANFITVECTPDWTCTDWSSCSQGRRTRECTDQNKCDKPDTKPTTTQECCTVDEDCGEGEVCINGICELEDQPFEDNETDWKSKDKILETTDATNYADVPCYHSKEKITLREPVDPYDIELEESREIIVDPFELSCTGSPTTLNVVVPKIYTDYDVKVCDERGCEIRKTVEDTMLKCGNGVVENYTRKVDKYHPRRKEVTSKVMTYEGKEAENKLLTSNAEIIYSGDAAHTTLESLKSSIPQPENPTTKIVGRPLVLSTQRSDLTIKLNYSELDRIDENSISLFYLKDNKWKYLGGDLNITGNYMSATLEDVDSIKNDEGKIVLSLLGNINPSKGTDMGRVYSPSEFTPNSALVLVHGLGSTPATFQPLINDFSLTKQPIDILTYSYPTDISLSNASENFADSLQVHTSSYDNIFVVGHSLGGVVSQLALEKAQEKGLSFYDNMKDLILLAPPNKGVEGLDNVNGIWDVIINTRVVTNMYNLDSEIFNDLQDLDDERLNKLDKIDYKVIAGTDSISVDLEGTEFSTSEVLSLESTNDGIITTNNAQNIGDYYFNEKCKNYWELGLNHIELEESSLTRQIIGAIISKELGLDKIRTGQTEYVQITVPPCSGKKQVFVTGEMKSTDDMDAFDLCMHKYFTSCNDGVQNYGEKGVDCGGPCEPCKEQFSPQDYVVLILGLIAILAALIFSYISLTASTLKRHRKGADKYESVDLKDLEKLESKVLRKDIKVSSRLNKIFKRKK